MLIDPKYSIYVRGGTFKRGDTMRHIVISFQDEQGCWVTPNPDHTFVAKVANTTGYIGDYPVTVIDSDFIISTKVFAKLPDDKYELEIWEIWPSEGDEEPDKTIYPTPETVVNFTIEANVTDKSGEVIKKIGFQDVVNAAVENAGLVKQTELAEYVKKNDLPSIPNLTDYVKKEELPKQPDLTKYALKSELPDLTSFLKTADADKKFATKSEIPSLDGYAKKTDLPKEPDLSNYATKDDLKTVTSNATRHAPTGWTLDRTTNPWTIWFDNGCGLQFPNYGTVGAIYGYGFSANERNTNLVSYPLSGVVMSASHGSLTLDVISKKTVSFEYWASDTKVINPIRTDADGYDWSNVYFNDESRAKKGQNYTDRQRVMLRVMYELGIWSIEDIKPFGLIKKEG